MVSSEGSAVVASVSVMAGPSPSSTPLAGIEQALRPNTVSAASVQAAASDLRMVGTPSSRRLGGRGLAPPLAALVVVGFSFQQPPNTIPSAEQIRSPVP